MKKILIIFLFSFSLFSAENLNNTSKVVVREMDGYKDVTNINGTKISLYCIDGYSYYLSVGTYSSGLAQKLIMQNGVLTAVKCK